ncbi:DUF2630 family protein [Saccharopolyspora cebuensis]|uniref:DUF2630 family protein n=1 Tax=Saccharopolyspora cebuensis TaxID=418759 RepID=A0ABV4C9J6_9PSEU
MAEDDIFERIGALVDEEHRLREGTERGQVDPATEQDRLRTIERRLDQCWDLLRQRRARQEFGADPDAAQPRPAHEVQNYRQ